MTVTDPLGARFGNPLYYEDSFSDINRSIVMDEFHKLDADKGKNAGSDRYESARQQFLKLLSQQQMIWHPTNARTDLDVAVSRIYRPDRSQFIAFMRIKPRGFRATRVLASDTEMLFLVLIGEVVITTSSCVKTLSRGSHVIIRPQMSYSMRSASSDQPVYLIFRIIKKNKNNY